MVRMLTGAPRQTQGTAGHAAHGSRLVHMQHSRHAICSLKSSWRSEVCAAWQQDAGRIRPGNASMQCNAMQSASVACDISRLQCEVKLASLMYLQHLGQGINVKRAQCHSDVCS